MNNPTLQTIAPKTTHASYLEQSIAQLMSRPYVGTDVKLFIKDLRKLMAAAPPETPTGGTIATSTDSYEQFVRLYPDSKFNLLEFLAWLKSLEPAPAAEEFEVDRPTQAAIALTMHREWLNTPGDEWKIYGSPFQKWLEAIAGNVAPDEEGLKP